MVNTQVWRFADRTTSPITDLTDDQLIEALQFTSNRLMNKNHFVSKVTEMKQWLMITEVCDRRRCTR